MYGKDERDLAVTLTRMADLARERTNFHQGEAKTKMAEWLQNDRRFDGFDPDRLIERVHPVPIQWRDPRPRRPTAQTRW